MREGRMWWMVGFCNECFQRGLVQDERKCGLWNSCLGRDCRWVVQRLCHLDARLLEGNAQITSDRILGYPWWCRLGVKGVSEVMTYDRGKGKALKFIWK